MKTTLSVFFLLLAVLPACKKNKFTTEPQIEIKSLLPEDVTKGDIVTLRIQFTDKEGDIKDSLLVVRKRFNTDNTINSEDTLQRLSLTGNPAPELTKGEIEVKFSYGEINNNYPAAIFLNTEDPDRKVAFGAILIDKAGHRSNYAESGRITLKKP